MPELLKRCSFGNEAMATGEVTSKVVWLVAKKLSSIPVISPVRNESAVTLVILKYKK